MTFKNLKNKNNLEKLTKAVEALNKNYSSDEDRYWKPEVDKLGNYFGIIRFLPTPSMDEDKDGLPWVQLFHHAFQGNNGWLFENCRTTIKDQCTIN